MKKVTTYQPKRKNTILRISTLAMRLAFIFMIFCFGAIYAHENNTIPLFSIVKKTGSPSLFETFKERFSLSDFSNKLLSKEDLSVILTAAFKIFHPDFQDETPARKVNHKGISVYVAMNDGLYLYDKDKNTLKRVLGEDIRHMTNKKVFTGGSGIKLIYVADLSKLKGCKQNDRELLAAADAESISQNIYLFCLSEGFKSILHEHFDKKGLAQAMKLKPQQRVILTQSLGFPKSSS